VVLDQQMLAVVAMDIGVATVQVKRISQVMTALADIPAVVAVQVGRRMTLSLSNTPRVIAMGTAN